MVGGGLHCKRPHLTEPRNRRSGEGGWSGNPGPGARSRGVGDVGFESVSRACADQGERGRFAHSDAGRDRNWIRRNSRYRRCELRVQGRLLAGK